MIKILVVDDELIVRIGIKSIVDWNSHGFQVVGEAVNGEDALSKIPLLDPDIIVTDIKMPKMNGIELIRSVRDRYKDIKIVVLSCYNDFDYVKQAMKLGASDYILKLSMQQDQLLDVMTGLKKEIECSMVKSSEMNSLYRNVNSNMDVIKEKFFNKILNGSYISLAYLLKEAEDLNIRFKEGRYLICVSQVTSFVNSKDKVRLEPDLLRYSILNILEEMVSRHYYGDVFACGGNGYVTVIVLDKETHADGDMKKGIHHLFNHIHERLYTYLNIYVSTGINGEIASGTDEICECYNKALAAACHSFYFSENKTIMYSELNYTGDVSRYYDGVAQKKIYHHIKLGEKENIKGCIHHTLDPIIDHRDIAPEAVKKVGTEIVGMLAQVARELNMVDEQGKTVDFYSKKDEIDCIGNIYELKKWFDDCIDQYMEYYGCFRKGAYTEGILRLKQYVNENFNKEITLETAAGFLNVGKNYFCSIFKKETGEKFFDYLIDVRIEKAKEFLRNTNLKNYEIAERVGYENFNYFSALFKRIVGVSPNEYKRKFMNL